MSAFEALAQEQADEVEALDAIYQDDFEKLEGPPFRWKIWLVPEQGEGEDVNHVAITLFFTVPEKYPQELPGIDVEISRGLTEKQGEELQQLAEETAQENKGMAMGYTVAEALRAWLCDNNVDCGDSGSMHAEMLRRMAERQREKTKAIELEAAKEALAASQEDEEDEEAARKRMQADGTPVTPETFAAWVKVFELEYGAKGESVDKATIASRPSGRDIFLRKAGGGGVEAEEEEEEEEEGEYGEAFIDEDAFADDDESDLEFEELDMDSDEDQG